MTRIFAFLTAIFIATTAHAQTYPERTDPGVNDFANIINSLTEARIATLLADIATQHDTEVAVVTLSSLRFYANDSTIEAYSTELFNQWGLGDDETNKGILLLVFRDDREVRIEVGSGYDGSINGQLDLVVSNDMLPHFRDADYSEGIEYGVDGLLSRVINAPATPAAPATPTPEGGESGGNTIYYVLGAIGAAIAGLFGLSRRNAAKFAAQPCTNCGKAGLEKTREVLREPSLKKDGAGETRITCPSCGHVDATPFTISKLKPKEPEVGGKSDGDGATGKW